MATDGLVDCPYCGASWDEPEPKPNQVNSYKCLKCGTVWSVFVEQSRETVLHATTVSEWEALEEYDRVVQRF